MSSMMSELYDYMRVCVEEEYNEDEYYEINTEQSIGEEDVLIDEY